MLAYIVRRLLLIVPTILGILLVSFLVIQFAPGGPVEQAIAQLTGADVSTSDRLNRSGGETFRPNNPGATGFDTTSSRYRGAQGLDPQIIKDLEKQFGFDKPAHERFLLLLWNYARFDFGRSYFHDAQVLDLIIQKMPVSISLGLWLTLLTYLISIPLGIAKAVRDGTRFDSWTSIVVIVGYAIPAFMFAIFLIVVFAGGSLNLPWGLSSAFPLRGLTSPNWHELSLLGKIGDYFWHLALPITAMLLGSFATMTLLTKNSFLDEIRKQYVVTARMKGLSERRVLYGHVFRNAMLPQITGLAWSIATMVGGALVAEIIFSYPGLGSTILTAVLGQDYPLISATTLIVTIMVLAANFGIEIIYGILDPRIKAAQAD